MLELAFTLVAPSRDPVSDFALPVLGRSSYRRTGIGYQYQTPFHDRWRRVGRSIDRLPPSEVPHLLYARNCDMRFYHCSYRSRDHRQSANSVRPGIGLAGNPHASARLQSGVRRTMIRCLKRTSRFLERTGAFQETELRSAYRPRSADHPNPTSEKSGLIVTSKAAASPITHFASTPPCTLFVLALAKEVCCQIFAI